MGEGGMGVVYRAAHTLVDRVVALKMLKPALAADPKAARRFLQEAQACVRLSHGGIVPVYEVGQQGDAVYLVMPLIPGQTLAHHAEIRGPLPPELALSITLKAAQALTYAHARGVVHRDIKPQNIMFKEPGSVTLLDMGLARVLERDDVPATSPILPDTLRGEAAALDTRVTDPGTLMGTLAYMSPEQIRNSRSADARSDIYSLGCTLYYLLTGQHAFCGSTAFETVDNHVLGRYRPLRDHLPDIPPLLERIVDVMIAVRPEDRYPTAASVAKAVMHCVATHYSPAPRASDPVRRMSLRIPGYECWAYPEAGNPRGGAFYELIPLAADRFALLVGDVAGSTLERAALVPRLACDLRDALHRNADPAEAMHVANLLVWTHSPRQEVFATVVICVIDAATSRVSFVNAGHLPPIIRRASGVIYEFPTEGSGLPLGIIADCHFEAVSVELSPHDTVILCTDEVVDACDGLTASNYGSQRLQAKVAGLEGHAPAVGQALLEDLRTWCRGSKDVMASALILVLGRERRSNEASEP
jgi:hypothetical protein